MPKEKEQQMSQDTKSIIAVLSLLLAYPIGVIVMWLLTRWPRWVKLLIAAPLLILPLLAVFAVAALIMINPKDKIEKAKFQYCQEKCSKEASQAACLDVCMEVKENRYPKYKFEDYK